NITSQTVATAFLHGWISRFGVPSSITTDRGRVFESSLWKELQRFLGSQHVHTTAYHPQSNGIIERFHRQLKASIMASEHSSNWIDALPLILLGFRSAFKTDLQSTSAEMVYGTTLRLPGELFVPAQTPIDPLEFVGKLRSVMVQLRPAPTRLQRHQHSFVSEDLATCTHVFLRRDCVRPPLVSPYDGPFLVLKRSRKFYKIQQQHDTVTVSIDRLKPAYFEEEQVSTPEQVLAPATGFRTESGRLVRKKVSFE
ncbi:Integrase catalytic core, partial [Trinorchestia longiramus]